jgi:hypothetical protein
VIRPVGDHSWENINWDGQGHRMCINMELGIFCRLLYHGMVNVKGQQLAACSWDHWALKNYANQGTYEDGVAHMFWVSLVYNFQILNSFYFDMRI